MFLSNHHSDTLLMNGLGATMLIRHLEENRLKVFEICTARYTVGGLDALFEGFERLRVTTLRYFEPHIVNPRYDRRVPGYLNDRERSREVLRRLARNSTIVDLSLDGMTVDGEDNVALFTEALQRSNVRSLTLRHMTCTYAAFERILGSLVNTRVSDLTLVEHHHHIPDWSAFRRIPLLRSLNIECLMFKPEFLKIVVETIAETKWVSLSLTSQTGYVGVECPNSPISIAFVRSPTLLTFESERLLVPGATDLRRASLALDERRSAFGGLPDDVKWRICSFLTTRELVDAVRPAPIGGESDERNKSQSS